MRTSHWASREASPRKHGLSVSLVAAHKHLFGHVQFTGVAFCWLNVIEFDPA